MKGELNAMCWDCYAHTIIKQSNGKIIVDLGISLTPPEGYGIELIARSNLTKHFWILNNCVGQIDPNYKDTLKAIFTVLPDSNFRSRIFNNTASNFPYVENDRVVQMKLVKINDFEFEQIDILVNENRGRGLGSTGLE